MNKISDLGDELRPPPPKKMLFFTNISPFSKRVFELQKWLLSLMLSKRSRISFGAYPRVIGIYLNMNIIRFSIV